MAESNSGFGARIRRMSTGALVGSAVVVLVVGLVIGLAGGYAIEHQRTKNDVANAKKQAATKASNSSSQGTGTGSSGGAAVRLTGKVGTTTADEVTLTENGATKKFLTNSSTVVVKASPGSASDITTGSRVVWRPVPGQLAQAAEVVVLPANAKMGSEVVSATPTSMTIKSNGKTVTISTQGATVENVTTAKTTDIAAGDKLVAQARQANGATTATEVIVLPTSSKFVA